MFQIGNGEAGEFESQRTHQKGLLGLCQDTIFQDEANVMLEASGAGGFEANTHIDVFDGEDGFPRLDEG